MSIEKLLQKLEVKYTEDLPMDDMYKENTLEHIIGIWEEVFFELKSIGLISPQDERKVLNDLALNKVDPYKVLTAFEAKFDKWYGTLKHARRSLLTAKQVTDYYRIKPNAVPIK